MSNVGNAIGKGKLKEGQPLTWSRARIGQFLIMLELIRCVKELTKEKMDSTSVSKTMPSYHRDHHKQKSLFPTHTNIIYSPSPIDLDPKTCQNTSSSPKK